MLKICLNHGFDDFTHIHTFINGLQQQPKLLIDSTTYGSLIYKNAKDVIAIIERMVLSDHQGQHNRNFSQRNDGIMELNTNHDILTQNKLLTQIMDDLEK